MKFWTNVLEYPDIYNSCKIEDWDNVYFPGIKPNFPIFITKYKTPLYQNFQGMSFQVKPTIFSNMVLIKHGSSCI